MKVLKGGLEDNQKKLKEKQKKYNQKYYDLYLDYQYGFDHKIDIKKAIYYGVKYISRARIDDLDYQQLLKLHCEALDISGLIKSVTFNDMIQMFPIIKEYNGKKYECKDYFSTMEYLNNINTNNLIKDEFDDFLWNYFNNDLMNFSVKTYLIVDRLLKFNGQQGLLEGFLDTIDPNGKIKTFTYNKEGNYMYDKQTGRTHKAIKRKKRNRFIKIVK